MFEHTTRTMPEKSESQIYEGDQGEGKKELLGEKREIREAQEKESVKIEKELKRYQDTKYKIYDDTPSERGAGRGHEVEGIEGYPYYYKFLKDCDYLGQLAILEEADTIVFFDKSARGFGMLTHEILPILRLEKSIKENKKPEEIKLPEVGFLNVEKKIFAKKEKYQESIYNFVKSLGDKVIIFDEASNAAPIFGHSFVEKDGSENDRWDGKFIYELRCEAQQYDLDTTLSRIHSNLESRLKRDSSKQKIIPYIGGSSYAGGFDSLSRRKGDLFVPAVDYNIQDREEDNIFIEPADLDQVLERLNKISAEKGGEKMQKEDIIKRRKQLRNEQGKMAWELFQQVILHKDPYKKEKG